MESKIGCYICKGCDIGKSLDIDKMVEVAKGDGKAAICKTHDILCSQEGVDLIKNDIQNEGINKVVVAACSVRVFPELFNFGNDIFTDRTNIREQVAWCHEPNDEDTQMLAEDCIRMGCTKVANGEPPEPFISESVSKDIMVVGGGVTGMTAAKAAALAGYKVVLVEKEDKLGGWATKFTKVFPKHPPYKEPENSDYSGLIKEVESHENITVYKSTVI